MPDSVSEVIAQVRQLRNEGNNIKAVQSLNSLENRSDLSQNDNLTYLVLKGDLYFRLGQYNEAIDIAEQAYQEAQKLENKIRSLDALITKQWCLGNIGRFDERIDTIEKGEKLLKEFSGEPSLKIINRTAELLLGKAEFYVTKNELEKALEVAMEGLALSRKGNSKINLIISLRLTGFIYFRKYNNEQAYDYFEQSLRHAKEINSKYFIFLNLTPIGSLYGRKGDLDKALKYFNESLVLAKELNSKQLIVQAMLNVGDVYRSKGELDHALEYLKQSLKIAEEMGNKPLTGTSSLVIGNIYSQKGEKQRVLEYYEKALDIFENSDYFASQNYYIGFSLAAFVFHHVEMGNIELAQQYLERLAKYKENRDCDQMFRLGKALILKYSNRIRDWIEAESILKRILEEEPDLRDIKVNALATLCELYLMELRERNDLEILKEVNSVIMDLLKMAKDENSFSLLAETNLIQAKLALIQMNFGDARRFLTASQKIADEHGLQLLAQKISSEHDLLLEQFEMWENLKNSNASMSERLELASINKIINRIQEKSGIDPPKMETEQPVLLAILSKTGYMVFSIPFTAEMTFDEKRLGRFISNLSSSSDQLFSEAIDRIKIGDYIVLLKVVEDFSVCYVFRGQSYNAGQKLNNFSEVIRENKPLIKVLTTAVRTGQILELSEIPDLEELITNNFMADPAKYRLPFKAYKGGDPFLFVSYAHSDKLQVYPIMDYLNRSGFNIWYDEGISVSEDWIESIVENINKSSAFLVFISPHIVDSEYVNKEISYALNRKKPFYAVYLKDTKLPDKLEFQISGIQSMKKYTIPDHEFYAKIKEVLIPSLSKKR